MTVVTGEPLMPETKDRSLSEFQTTTTRCGGSPVSKQVSRNLGGCGARGIAGIGALLALTFAAAGAAQAQTASPAPAPAKAEDSSITWKGITLYGIIDIGLQ